MHHSDSLSEVQQEELPLEKMNLEELSEWLSDMGIPYKFCKILEGEATCLHN